MRNRINDLQLSNSLLHRGIQKTLEISLIYKTSKILSILFKYNISKYGIPLTNHASGSVHHENANAVRHLPHSAPFIYMWLIFDKDYLAHLKVVAVQPIFGHNCHTKPNFYMSDKTTHDNFANGFATISSSRR